MQEKQILVVAIEFQKEIGGSRASFSDNLDPVHTYPDIFESATSSFRIRLLSTCIRRIRKQNRKFLNPLSRVEIFESDNILDTCGRWTLDIF